MLEARVHRQVAQIQAWSHGPVLARVYQNYKGCGSSSIVLPDTDPFSWDEVDPDTAELLSKVWNTYGGFSAGHLRNMTHEEPPWQRHWQDGVRGISIPQQEIEEYFASRH